MNSLKDTDATVRHLLAAAGLKPRDDELAILVAAYPDYRAEIDALHGIDEARYENSALVFSASPEFASWDDPTPGD